uniref:Uncharacterized protein n=1 Tax=Solanum lycopersicum TaxID=4081 RepID=A0A3Q7E9F8_SOLLC
MKNLEYPIEVKTVYCLTPESCLECIDGEGTEKMKSFEYSIEVKIGMCAFFSQKNRKRLRFLEYI